MALHFIWIDQIFLTIAMLLSKNHIGK